MVTGVLVFLAWLVAAPSAATAKLPECLSVCETGDCCAADLNGCLSTPCGDYDACVADAKADFAECIEDVSDDKNCQFTVGGRCTVIRECLEGCEEQRRISLKQCRKGLRNVSPASKEPPFCTVANCTANLKPRQQRSLARVCEKKCSNKTPRPSTTTSTSTSTSTTGPPTSTTGPSTSSTTTTSTSSSTLQPPLSCESPGIDQKCLQPCLMRIDSLREDYSDCEDRCEGHRCARLICEQTSRNVACLAIKARCTLKGDNTDLDYIGCCKDPKNIEKGIECLEERSEAPCRVLPTTTTSTRPSSTTTVTVRTTTTTNTTI